jgi:hypothetical protein
MASTRPEAKLARPPYDPELAVIRDTFPPFGPITNELIIAHHQDPSLYGPGQGYLSHKELSSQFRLIFSEFSHIGSLRESPRFLLGCTGENTSVVGKRDKTQSKYETSDFCCF